MTPEKALRAANLQLKNMKALKTKYVAVGVLANEATGRVYNNGITVLEVAAFQEYGLGHNPQRSFLRMPQEFKQAGIKRFINIQLEKVFDGMRVEKGLGLIGTYAVNLSQDAFDTEGFGNWPKLKAATINAKGSSKVLTDKGILKSSVTWEIR